MTRLVLELLWIQNWMFAEIKPSLKVLVALVKHPLGLLLRPDIVFVTKTENAVYLRKTNALPLRAFAQPCLNLCFTQSRNKCLPDKLGFFDLQLPGPISLVQQVLFKWKANIEFAPSFLV